jgi:acid phosphatase (class B)
VQVARTMMKHAALPLILLAGACTSDVTGVQTVDDLDGTSPDAYSSPGAIHCATTDAAATPVELVLTPNGRGFDIADSTGAMFSLTSQRPSLNVAIDDGTGDPPNEFVDFRPSGLTVVPAIGSPRFELTLGDGAKTLTYATGTSSLELTCTVSRGKLLHYLGIAPTDDIDTFTPTSVGFDIDDTLLFSTPTFTRAFATGGTPAPTDTTFWTQANSCDPGCDAATITLADGTTKDLPANDPSDVKLRVSELVEEHLASGAQVYAITARADVQGDVLRDYIASELGIAADHVYFEPNGKVARMQALGIQVFYGDADSDMTDSQQANSQGIRVLRSPKSSYRDGNRLAKYHPGYYGEPIVADSYE